VFVGDCRFDMLTRANVCSIRFLGENFLKNAFLGEDLMFAAFIAN